MNVLPKCGFIAQRRAATAAVCGIVLAVGGPLLAMPANASDLGRADVCTSPGTSVDTNGAGTGAADRTDSMADDSRVVNCVTSLALGAPSVPPATTTSPGSRMQTSGATSGSEPPATDAATSIDSTGSVPEGNHQVDVEGSTVTTAASPTMTKLAQLLVLRSSNIVYPVRDGFLDSVRFDVRAMTAAGTIVPVIGTAVLTKSGKHLKTWHIDGATHVLTWDGRIGKAIRTGLYSIQVTAFSIDGSELVQHALVRVLSNHLVEHSMTVRSNVGSTSVAADMPHVLLKAYRTGRITCRVVTVASVTGPAKLVYSNNGVTRSVALKNGTHTTKALPVPPGFSHVIITHDWAKGAAHLKSLKAIWSYTTLK